MKYNRSEIMKRAWGLYHKYGASFADWLRQSWEIEKGINKSEEDEKAEKAEIEKRIRNWMVEEAVNASKGVEVDYATLHYSREYGYWIAAATVDMQQNGKWSSYVRVFDVETVVLDRKHDVDAYPDCITEEVIFVRQRAARLAKGGKRVEIDNFLPEVQYLNELPELTGSEKQVAWAKKIRMDIYRELTTWMFRDEGKIQIRTSAPEYIFSVEKMREWANPGKYTYTLWNAGEDPDWEKAVKKRAESLRIAAEQFTRIRELLEKETSARFWIDHRWTYPGDPRWQALRKKMLGY